MSLLADLVDDFRDLRDRTGSWFDAFVSPVVFVGANAAFGTRPAAFVAFGLAALLVVYRLARRQSVQYAVAGVGGTVFASALAVYSGRGETYFIPGVVTSALYALFFFGTMIWRKPAVAWASRWTRGYPTDWYWHPRIRPAYMETTMLWGVFFAGRAALLGRAVADEALVQAATIRVAAGWPAIVVLIVVTQLYGRWRLARLGGPSVPEFERGASAPWTGHEGGF